MLTVLGMKGEGNMNEDIKRMARNNRVYLWQVADKLGVSEATFNRRLRKELNPTEKATIYSIIGELKRERELSRDVV
jgi:hypothetical protein